MGYFDCLDHCLNDQQVNNLCKIGLYLDYQLFRNMQCHNVLQTSKTTHSQHVFEATKFNVRGTIKKIPGEIYFEKIEMIILSYSTSLVERIKSQSYWLQ